MHAERQVKFFRNGRNQAVRIPREWELPGDGGTMRKEGTRLIIETKPKRTLLDVLDELEPLGPEDWLPEVEDLPPREIEL